MLKADEAALIDRLISWAALLVSGTALLFTMRIQKRQPLLIEKQIEKLVRESRSGVQAAVTVALVSSDTWAGKGTSDKIIITNAGPAEARDIQLVFLDGKNPLPEGEAGEKLPVPVLATGGTVSLIAAVSMSCHPPFDVLLTWVDGTGRRSQETRLA